MLMYSNLLHYFFPSNRLLEQARQERCSNNSRSSSPSENGHKNYIQNLSTKRMRVDDSGSGVNDSSGSVQRSKVTEGNRLNFNLSSSRINSNSNDDSRLESKNDDHYGYQCLAVNISPELGERVCISGERSLIEEVFPEISQDIMDSSKAAAWNQDSKHVIRFPLNGYCKLNSLQTIVRLLNNRFQVMASNGGGVEGQQFSEYLMVRKVPI